MQMNRRSLLAAAFSVAAGPALAQPWMGHGGGAGPMGGWGHADPAAYLNNLKQVLGITAMQEAAWNEYAATVKGAADQMQGTHQTMFEAMGTASWQERRDMMNRMFEVRQQSFDTVHAAADKLMPSLDASQRAKATTWLPGLVGPRMMHGGMHGGQQP